VRVIEDDAAFGWMRDRARFAGQEVRQQSVNDRLLSILTNVQARKWRELTGEPVHGSLVPFGGAISPPSSGKTAPAPRPVPGP